ncbi:hypothetical protein CBR_g8802 [Chara braunii]|uniref:Uncharacterized protein n=1 Tax=Chara braunii TaxID=69332 RepID=A0A388KN68_CHABU|nr:hypothetical protein CBR_g8802 [Chara braunii]|eukprot:GBG71383.1 hypothetical protein CBR_g8802 [Chara braunii]
MPAQYIVTSRDDSNDVVVELDPRAADITVDYLRRHGLLVVFQGSGADATFAAKVGWLRTMENGWDPDMVGGQRGRVKPEGANMISYLAVNHVLRDWLVNTLKKEENALVDGRPCKVLYRSWATQVEQEQAKQDLQAQRFWIRAVRVPYLVMPFLKAAVIKDYPPERNKAAPRLMNRRTFVGASRGHRPSPGSRWVRGGGTGPLPAPPGSGGGGTGPLPVPVGSGGGGTGPLPAPVGSGGRGTDPLPALVGSGGGGTGPLPAPVGSGGGPVNTPTGTAQTPLTTTGGGPPPVSSGTGNDPLPLGGIASTPAGAAGILLPVGDQAPASKGAGDGSSSESGGPGVGTRHDHAILQMMETEKGPLGDDDGRLDIITQEQLRKEQLDSGIAEVQQAIPGEEEHLLQQKSSLQPHRRKILVGGPNKVTYKPYAKPGQGKQADNNKEREEWADIRDDENETEQYRLTEQGSQQGQLQTDHKLVQKHKGKQIDTFARSQHQDEIQPQQQYVRAAVFPGSILDAMAGGKPCVVVPLIFSATDGELKLMAAMFDQGHLAIPHFKLHEDPVPGVVFTEITKWLTPALKLRANPEMD